MNRNSTFYLLALLYFFTSPVLYALNESNSADNPQKTIEQELESKPKAKPNCSAPDVSINQGELCGLNVKTTNDKQTYAYLGIPFGETTAGDSRWRAPVPDSGWQGKLEATQHGLACPQINRFVSDLPYSEDCLTLNVWSPDINPDKPKAVVVYILGGSYLYGYAGNPVYDGSYVSANGDIVLVTMNYRTGSFGFLAGVKDKDTGEKIDGNFGLMDQVLAMKWVKENIAKFGGDPNQITLHGESAGAGSVAIHLTGEPSTTGLFNNVIMQSNPLGMPFKSLIESKPIAQEFANKLSCANNDISCMRSKSAKEIVEAQNMAQAGVNLLLHGMKDFLIWGPVIDNKIVNGNTVLEISKKKNTKPTVIGTNENEAVLFVAFAMNKLGLNNLSDAEYSLALEVLFRSNKVKDKILKKYPHQGSNNESSLSAVLTDYLFTCPSLYLADNSSMKTWVYLFDHVPSYNLFSIIGVSACKEAVCHAAEVPFVFHTAENLGYQFTEQERILSRTMINYWTNFVKNIDPNGILPEGILPHWPKYKSQESNVILVTPIDKIVSKQDLRARCEFWNEIGYDQHHSLWDLF
ncbi:MAG: carboxylesterase/lipase family protein [Thermodesulfobacteriota bacterium]